MNFPIILSKRLYKITKQFFFTIIITTILSHVIELVIIINIKNFENLDEPKKRIDVIYNEDKFWKFAKKTSIVPQFSLWLKDDEIIWDAGVGCESESIDQGRSYVDKNINISLCFFSRYSSYSGSGGVIYVFGVSYSMNVNNSMFYNCLANNGGAIYFESTNACLRMICSNSCSASWSHFSYLVASQLNQLEYLSVSNCSHSTSGYYSIRLYTGNQIVDNTNSSMNNALQTSGIYISSPSSLSSSHCTFSNNKVSHSICIEFSSTSGTISMSYANYVHNNSPFNGVVFVNGAGLRMMMYSIFNNNQNSLFCVWEGSLEVSHSFIDHSGSFSTSTAVLTSNNNSFTNRITYQLQFFNSLHCYADIPLIDTTPLITIPRTYAECIFTLQLANWREIGVIFSFAFLYQLIILMIS